MQKTVVCLVMLLLSGLATAELPDFTDLINNASPSVVKINTQSYSSSEQDFNIQNVPPSIREYFEQFNEPQRRSASVGSGFLVSEDGYIVTNNHVVEGADEIRVRLNDRREYDARVVGTDPSSDLALLKIDETNLSVVEFSDSQELEVGDWVLAIGSPFDLDYSASAGIVSAIGRSLPNERGQNYVPFIQTDVAINPGNSGGPLFNMDGEVVGINSQIYSRSGGYMGLSFAIPASVAIDVIQQLKERGTVSRGWLGVSISDLSADQASSFGLSKPRGALISQVFAGSPAAASGLRGGDVILEFDGNPIMYFHDLPRVVGLISPGKTVTAKVLRQKKEQSIRVTVGELSQDGATRTSVPARESDENTDDTLGLKLKDVSERTLSSMGLANGVEVVDVSENSPAYRAGIQKGDLISQLNFEDVFSTESFHRVLREAEKGQNLPVLFYRDGSSIFRTIRVDD